MATTWIDWFSDGGLSRRIRLQHGTGKKDGMVAIQDTVQHDRNQILADNHEIRKSDNSRQGDMSFGRRVGRIPLFDYQYVLPKSHPELFEGDTKQQQMAWVAFLNSPEGEMYKLREA